MHAGDSSKAPAGKLACNRGEPLSKDVPVRTRHANLDLSAMRAVKHRGVIGDLRRKGERIRTVEAEVQS